MKKLLILATSLLASFLPSYTSQVTTCVAETYFRLSVKNKDLLDKKVVSLMTLLQNVPINNQLSKKKKNPSTILVKPTPPMLLPASEGNTWHIQLLVPKDKGLTMPELGYEDGKVRLSKLKKDFKNGLSNKIFFMAEEIEIISSGKKGKHKTIQKLNDALNHPLSHYKANKQERIIVTGKLVFKDINPKPSSAPASLPPQSSSSNLNETNKTNEPSISNVLPQEPEPDTVTIEDELSLNRPIRIDDTSINTENIPESDLKRNVFMLGVAVLTITCFAIIMNDAQTKKKKQSQKQKAKKKQKQKTKNKKVKPVSHATVGGAP